MITFPARDHHDCSVQCKVCKRRYDADMFPEGCPLCEEDELDDKQEDNNREEYL